MLKSMTAYGRAILHSSVGHFVVEIQSVNRKFLEVQVTIPKELARFEAELKKKVQNVVSRGQVTLKVFATFDETLPIVVKPNLLLVKQLKQAWDQIADELGLDKKDFQLSLLKGVEDVLSFEDNFEGEDIYRESLNHVLDSALKSFIEMKTREGLALQEDILNRLAQMRHWMIYIEKRAPDAPKKYREKLGARLEELFPGSIENEDRILREIAVFAEKIDVTEEITRFISHLKQFEEVVHSPDGAVGKTLEFIVQEMNREVNTIGSKSSDLEITRHVIHIKGELERIREQIQNVE